MIGRDFTHVTRTVFKDSDNTNLALNLTKLNIYFLILIHKC